MPDEFSVRIEGLDEFRRELKRLGKEATKLLNDTLKRALSPAQRQARREYVARYRSGRTERTIKARSSGRATGLAFGGPRYPYAPGQEFGSNRYKQFAPWSGPAPGGKGSQGRFIFPAVRAQAKPVERELQRGFLEVARRTAFREP